MRYFHGKIKDSQLWSLVGQGHLGPRFLEQRNFIDECFSLNEYLFGDASLPLCLSDIRAMCFGFVTETKFRKRPET